MPLLHARHIDAYPARAFGARIQRVRIVTKRFTLAAVRCLGSGHDMRLIRVRAHNRNTADVCLIRF